MSDDKALQPAEQKQVLFYEDEITAVRMSDGRVFVPVRPLCDRLGVAWSAQRRRINRDAVLSDEVRGVAVSATPGGQQEMICIPLHLLQQWVDGINAARLKPKIRERVILWQSRGKYKERDGFVYIIKATEGTGGRSYFKIGRTCASPKDICVNCK